MRRDSPTLSGNAHLNSLDHSKLEWITQWKKKRLDCLPFKALCLLDSCVKNFTSCCTIYVCVFGCVCDQYNLNLNLKALFFSSVTASKNQLLLLWLLRQTLKVLKIHDGSAALQVTHRKSSSSVSNISIPTDSTSPHKLFMN